MESRSAELTETSPGQAAADGVDARRPLALLWVHPRTFVTPLADFATLGREHGCTSVLEGTQVSRQHAKLERRGGHLVFTDLGSRNGSFVQGERTTESVLTAGSVVRIAQWVGVVCELDVNAIREPWFWQPQPGLVVGPRTRELWQQLELLAPSEQPILIEGPTGTGKEVIARAVHACSGRKGPLVAVNCAALPESLVEAQLFGHAKGAFTGATQAAVGLIGSADGGTLLLDEIADLPLSHQAKLLRTLEERSVLRVGETTPRPVNVRYLAACQVSLWQLSREGQFRADLLGRLGGGRLRLLPLNARREEIPSLFRHYFAEAGGAPERLTGEAIEVLCLGSWPLNVRQLVQAARLAAMKLSGNDPIEGHALQGALAELLESSEHTAGVPLAAEADAPRRSSAPPSPVDVTPGRRGRWLKAHQETLEQLLSALQRCDGNVSEACRTTGIPRWRATRLLAAYDEQRHRPDLES